MPRVIPLGHLKLQHLKMLMAMSETGSMARAAKKLAISQPVVSKGIAELEGVLGVRLFDRTPQGVEATRYGRALLKRSIAIFDDLKSSVEEIKYLADPSAGHVRVGSTEGMLAGFGAAVIEILAKQYPGISVHVIQSDSETLINRELAERRIDLALVPLLRRWSGKEFDETILFHERQHVLVSVKSRWARERKVTLSQLVNERWCLAPSPVGSLLANAFAAQGLPMPRIAVSTASPHLIMRLIESGSFVGHVNGTLLHYYANRFAIKILRIRPLASPYPIAIVTAKNRIISPVAELFINSARNVARRWKRGAVQN